MLTPKQEVFVQNLVKGMSQADAYRSAYNTQNMSDKTIHEAASRLVADSKVSARLFELRNAIAQDSIMNARKRLEWLAEVVTGDNDINAKLKAVDLMNKMTGEYVQRIEADVKSDVTINIELMDE